MMSEGIELSSDLLEGSHRRALLATEKLRLTFSKAARYGYAGSRLGSGAGSSIDFLDHRAYLPGDDPRRIDWQAFARTKQYIVRLYREEVSPRLDLVIDLSDSMFFDREKGVRALELLYFVIESARCVGASLRVYSVFGANSARLLEEEILGYLLRFPQGSECYPELSAIGWREGAMRVIISDLLFAGEPKRLLNHLASGRNPAALLVPYAASEAEPDWLGNMRLVDCESRAERLEYLTAERMAEYRSAYHRHFDLWREECARLGLALIRVADGAKLEEALLREGIGSGAFEVVG